MRAMTPTISSLRRSRPRPSFPASSSNSRRSRRSESMRARRRALRVSPWLCRTVHCCSRSSSTRILRWTCMQHGWGRAGPEQTWAAGRATCSPCACQLSRGPLHEQQQCQCKAVKMAKTSPEEGPRVLMHHRSTRGQHDGSGAVTCAGRPTAGQAGWQAMGLATSLALCSSAHVPACTPPRRCGTLSDCSAEAFMPPMATRCSAILWRSASTRCSRSALRCCSSVICMPMGRPEWRSWVLLRAGAGSALWCIRLLCAAPPGAHLYASKGCRSSTTVKLGVRQSCF